MAAHQKIDIRFNTAVTDILGEAKVTSLRTRQSRDGAVADLEVAAIFAYIGLQPNTAVLQDRLSSTRPGEYRPMAGCEASSSAFARPEMSQANRPVARSARPAMVRAPLSRSIAI